MARPTFAALASAWALLGGALACSPEVLIASSAQSGGGTAAGTAALAGTNAGGAGGFGNEPSESAGQGGTEEPPQAPRLLADSVADFALVQGEHDWFYGYDDGTSASFTLMTRTSVITNYTPETGDVWDCWATDTAHWTQLFQLGAHPNGIDTSAPSPPLLERAVRRWRSTHAGAVRVSGEIAKIDVAVDGSNGVDASVVLDGTEIYGVFIGGADGAGLSYEVVTQVNVGSTLDFVLDPHESDDHHDLARFTAVIERVSAQ